MTMDPREQKIQALAEAIYKGFVEPDSGDYLRATGSLICPTNLRFKKTKTAFESVRGVHTESGSKLRFWTKAAIRDAIDFMCNQYPVEIPLTPNFSWKEWLEKQTLALHHLAQRSRKNEWQRSQSSSTVDSMDNAETLAYNPFEDCMFFFVATACFATTFLS